MAKKRNIRKSDKYQRENLKISKPKRLLETYRKKKKYEHPLTLRQRKKRITKIYKDQQLLYEDELRRKQARKYDLTSSENRGTLSSGIHLFTRGYLPVCEKRKTRRRILFSRHLQGKGIAGPKRRIYNATSKIICK